MSGRSALALALASLVAGALNYLYQVHAASVLDASAFGLLSAWLARVTLLGTGATVVQFLSLDHALDDRRFVGALRALGVLSIVVVVIQLVLGTRLSTTLLGATAIGSGVVLYAVIGQLQARLRLGVVAAVGVATAGARFALPFAWPREGRASAFYVAQATAFFVGLLVAAAFVSGKRGPSLPGAPSEASAPTRPRRARLARPVLLESATVLFPLIDVLVISSFQDAATTGAFSRVTLASRLVFFAGAAALQILLPHELHAAASGRPLPPFPARLQRWIMPAGIGGALVLAVAVDVLVLHPVPAQRPWLYASCLAASFLVAILGHVNQLAARDRLEPAAAIVGAVVVTSGAAAALAASGGEPVTRYTLVVLAGDALVLLFSAVATRRARAATTDPKT